MLKHRYIDLICIIAVITAAVMALMYMNGRNLGIVPGHTVPEYAERLFDDARVHTIDLQVDDWEGFLGKAPDEEYISCNVVIDGESYSNIGLRAKGNNSKSLTEEYGLYRYSLKLEFDHYQSGLNYYGLDKLSLDSSFQDNSYMKTWLVYDMMEYMGVATPLCSYANVTVNGKPWGLFLAVEEPEEAFAKRNFGMDYGKLYKPDYKSLDDENLDVGLCYIDDNPDSYDNIFRNAKFKTDDEDKRRLINSIKVLDSGQNIDKAVNVDMTLRYFAVQVFCLNSDGYLGFTGHNYILHEKNGVMSILPWDYNLAFGTYYLGMTDAITDGDVIINYPIGTPWTGDVMVKRPLYHKLMQKSEYYMSYKNYMDKLIKEYFESGLYETKIRKTMKMIDPYVKNDAVAFCGYEDYMLGADTLLEICRMRSESVRGQLDGIYPSSFKEQNEMEYEGIDTANISIYDLGDFDDLENAKERQDKALYNVMNN